MNAKQAMALWNERCKKVNDAFYKEDWDSLATELSCSVIADPSVIDETRSPILCEDFGFSYRGHTFFLAEVGKGYDIYVCFMETDTAPVIMDWLYGATFDLVVGKHVHKTMLNYIDRRFKELSIVSSIEAGTEPTDVFELCKKVNESTDGILELNKRELTALDYICSLYNSIYPDMVDVADEVIGSIKIEKAVVNALMDAGYKITENVLAKVRELTNELGESES